MSNLSLDIAAIEESILAKEFSSILNKIDDLLISNPDHPELLYLKGICLLNTNAVDLSLEYFFKAKELDSQNKDKYENAIAIVYKTSGDLFFNNDDFDNARSLYEKGLEFVPNSILLLLATANIDFRLNNYDKAKILYNDILKIDPDNLFVNHNLGLINSNNKDYDIAKKYFLKAININDKSYKSFIQLALIYITEKKYIDALNYLKKAQLISPEDESIKKYIIQIHLLTNEVLSLVKFLKVNYIEGTSIYKIPNFVKSLMSFLRDIKIDNVSDHYLSNPLSYIMNKDFNINDITEMQSILENNILKSSIDLDSNNDFDLKFNFIKPSKLKDFFDKHLNYYYGNYNNINDDFFLKKPKKYKYIFSTNKFSNTKKFTKISDKHSWINGIFLYNSDHINDYKDYTITFYYGDRLSNYFNANFTKSIDVKGFTLLFFPGFLNYDIDVKTNNAQLLSLIDVIPDMDL